MRLSNLHSWPPAHGSRAARGFTLVEMMVASGIVVLILGAAMSFINFASLSMSGITAQTTLNEQGANAVNFFQTRSRLATFASNDASGNIVTLGFDSNPDVDSSGDRLTYNDRDYFERFQLIGTSTNLQSSTNRLVFIDTNGVTTVLVPTGVCKLPKQKVFTVTNNASVLIRFGIVDNYAPDRYQSIDIQSMAVLLNRRSITNYISILP